MTSYVRPFSASGRNLLPVIELVGLPGSGKSTIEKNLVRSRKVVPLRKALRTSVGRWFASEVYGRSRASFLFGNDLVLRWYLRQAVRNLRSSFSENPTAINLVSGFVRNTATQENLHELRFLENVATFLELISRDYLLTKYTTTSSRAVLLDEHWVQLIAFVLNWGRQDEWIAWAKEVLDHVHLPQTVIWFQGAAQLSEARQVGRGKIAVMFRGCDDITVKGAALEQRAELLQYELQQRGVDILTVDASWSSDKVTELILSAL